MELAVCATASAPQPSLRTSSTSGISCAGSGATVALSDKEMAEFSRGLHAEVIERSRDSAGQADFKENAFTQLVVGYLTDAGVAEDGQVCYFEKKLPPPYGTVKTNGYYIPEEL